MLGLTKRTFFPGMTALAMLFMAACVDPETQLRDQTNRTSASECAGKECFFVNSPVQTLPQAVRIPGRSALFHPTAQRLDFVDNGDARWSAPQFTLTDGASIPPLFVPFIGDAKTLSFRNAAALHDAYCGIGNELLPQFHSDRWQKVHRMFYDTLVVSGTPHLKAKIMFAAVWLGGPRWFVNKQPDSRMDQIPDTIKIKAFLQTKAYIEGSNPDVSKLIDYMKWREVWMLAQQTSRKPTIAPPPEPKPGTGAGTGGGVIGPIGGGQGTSCAVRTDPACVAAGRLP